MNVTPTILPQGLQIETKVFCEVRSLFFESFDRSTFTEVAGQASDFEQGFVTLSETAEFLNKITNYYAPEFECRIEWSAGLVSQLSAKDLANLNSARTEVFP
jgi:dTDP-4-dehydrorhamnose 3,5-epimerase-like enzyme